MLSVYKKELSVYFKSPTGYAVIGVMLLFAGIFVSAYSFFYYSPTIESSYSNILFVMLAVVPFLSMRSLAEEKHMKTDILMNSLPIRTRSYVIGKYLAELTLVAIPVSVTFLYTIVLSFYGNVNFLSALSATFAFMLCCAAMLAVGLFISSLFESLALTATVTFAALFMTYFIPNIVQMTPSGYLASFAVLSVTVLVFAFCTAYITSSKTAGGISLLSLESILIAILCFSPSTLDGASVTVINFLSLTERFSSFSDYGIFDLGTVVYYNSVSVFFVFLACRSTEWRIRK